MKSTIDTLFNAVIIIVVWLGMKYLPGYDFVWGVLAVSMLIWNGHKGRMQVIVMAVALALGAVVLFRNTAAFFLAASVIPGAAMGYAVAREAKIGKVIWTGFFAVIMGLGGYWLYRYEMGLSMPLHLIEQTWHAFEAQYMKALKEQADAVAGIYQLQGMSVDMVSEQYRLIREELARLRPSFFVMGGWLKVLTALGITRMIAGKPTALPITPFQWQRMPWQLVWIVIAGLAAWLAGDQFRLDPVQIGGANVLFLMAWVAFYYGMSLVVFLFKRWSPSTWVIAFMIILGLLLFPQVFLFITILGLFDPLLDYRNIDGKRGNSA